MSLDDVEKLARDYVWASKETGNTGSIADDLARALLAVLPVVRAAEAWRDDVCGPRACILLDAIDEMRRAIGGGE